MRRLAGMCTLLALTVGAGSAQAEGLGVITQLAGADGCHNATIADGCSEAKTMANAAGVAVSPDATSVYVSSFSNATAEPSLVVFRAHAGLREAHPHPVRDAGRHRRGWRALRGGTARRRRAGTRPRGLRRRALALRSLRGRRCPARLHPSSDGLLSPVQCLSKDGTNGACVDVRGFSKPTGVTVSPDDRFVYVTDNDKTITSFSRDGNGALAQLPIGGCLSDTAVGPDGEPCDDSGTLIGNSKRLVIAPDGNHAYAVNRTDGVLLTLRPQRADRGPLTQVRRARRA